MLYSHWNVRDVELTERITNAAFSLCVPMPEELQPMRFGFHLVGISIRQVDESTTP